jgi:hypothetical protein
MGMPAAAPVQFLFKGLNPLTEHFSAFEADLPLADAGHLLQPAAGVR